MGWKGFTRRAGWAKAVSRHSLSAPHVQRAAGGGACALPLAARWRMKPRPYASAAALRPAKMPKVRTSATEAPLAMYQPKMLPELRPAA